jgi:hypothetical protein
MVAREIGIMKSELLQTLVSADILTPRCFGASAAATPLEATCEYQLVNRWRLTPNRTASSLKGLFNSFLDTGENSGVTVNWDAAFIAVYQCGYNRTCTAQQLFSIWRLGFKLKYSGERMISEFKETVNVLQSCWVECGPLKQKLRSLSMALLRDQDAFFQSGFLLGKLYCDAIEKCVVLAELSVVTGNEMEALLAVTARYSSAAPAVDPAIALAGLIMSCVVLALAIGVLVLGIIWKTVFARLVWPLLLAAIVSVAGVRISVWAWALSRSVPFGPLWSGSYPIEPVIGATLSVLVSLIFCLVSLLILYLFVVVVHVASEHRKRVLAIVFLIGAVVLIGGTIASVICTYTLGDVKSDLSYYLAGKTERQK